MDALSVLERLWDYTMELESAYSVWAVSRPSLAPWPSDPETNKQLGQDVCALLGREWPGKK